MNTGALFSLSSNVAGGVGDEGAVAACELCWAGQLCSLETQVLAVCFLFQIGPEFLSEMLAAAVGRAPLVCLAKGGSKGGDELVFRRRAEGLLAALLAAPTSVVLSTHARAPATSQAGRPRVEVARAAVAAFKAAKRVVPARRP